jgi:HSP20 family molecular chaperone IbpA
MATFLMPRVAFAPAYCAPSRGYYRRSYAPAPRLSLDPFLSLVDETLNQLQREAQRQARQHRTFNAHFNVQEHGDQYLVQGQVPGFEQEDFDVEFTDEHTLKISGSTEQRAHRQTEAQPELEKTEVEQPTSETAQPTEQAADSHSETSSVKSYQATVEDDYEDLGAETETVSSAPSSSAKGKEKVSEEPKEPQAAVVPSQSAENATVPQQQQPENHNWSSERFHGSFTRTFRFPVRIDTANVRASLKNGILSITVPKASAPQIRRILIQ